MVTPVQVDLTRIVLAVLFIGALMAATFWVLQPFLGALIWAVMIVVSTWSVMRSVQRFLGGRRWAAVAVMSIGLLLVLVVPLAASIGTVVGHVDEISGWAKDLGDLKVPPPPSWLAGLPFVGEQVAGAWQQVATGGVETLGAKLAPYAAALVKWFVAQIGNFGVLFLQFLLTVVAAAVLYAHGEGAADFTLRFGRRLAGEQGENAIRLSGQAIRGVALGVVVTAFVQALIGGIGLAIAGVPFATVLTALMFLLAVAQIGAVPVLVIPIIWLYWSGSYGLGTFLLVVAVIAGTLDNVLRPFLIKRGADLPLLLILVGVIGGLVSFGLIGIFVGPVVLAVTYTLLNAWIAGRPAGDPRTTR
jgi:predicted PurR-regulated permease PerM